MARSGLRGVAAGFEWTWTVADRERLCARTGWTTGEARELDLSLVTYLLREARTAGGAHPPRRG